MSRNEENRMNDDEMTIIEEIIAFCITLVIFWVMAKLFWAYAPIEIQEAFKNATGLR